MTPSHAPLPADTDTIVAIATPPGAGAIGVVRVSGLQAVAFASRIVRLAGPDDLEAISPRVLHRARVLDPAAGLDLDVALVVKMLGPRSYTGEDIVELSCHGNPVLLAEIVRFLMESGARLAEPGEFTRRAFLNGRLDLLQAEAVAELVGARTERAVRLAARQLRGGVSSEIVTLRDRLLDLVAGLEVDLDFPEDAVGVSKAEAVGRTRDLASSLKQLIAKARRGRAVLDGFSVMLAGAPNVGKSLLLNRLLGAERAIVSATPGTTRDLVDGTLTILGVQIRLMDGAGLGTPCDAIDEEGMRRARQALAEADLVLAVLDMGRPISAEDREVLALTENTERLIVANKSDLRPALGHEVVVDCVCSALTGAGLEKLTERLNRWVEGQIIGDGEEGGLLASLRVLDKLAGTQAALERAADGLETAPAEAVLVDLREAKAELERVLGIDTDEAVLDRIFATFCIGK